MCSAVNTGVVSDVSRGALAAGAELEDPNEDTAFSFSDVKGIAPARCVFGRHVAVLSEQEGGKGSQVAMTEGIGCRPSGEVGVELGVGLDRRYKRINAGEFEDSAASRGKKLVVEV